VALQEVVGSTSVSPPSTRALPSSSNSSRRPQSGLLETKSAGESNFLAGQIGALGKHADALAAYERAAAEAEVLARNEPTNQYLRSMYRQARRGKCASLVDLGRIDEAVEEMLLMLGVSRNSDGSLPTRFRSRIAKRARW